VERAALYHEVRAAFKRILDRRPGVETAKCGADSFLIQFVDRRKKIRLEVTNLWNSKCPP
jgi:hypothetical protein